MKKAIVWIWCAMVILSSLSLAYLRITGHKDMIFQATAHCCVGIFLGTGVMGRYRPDLMMAGFLIVIEVACFLVKV